MSGSEAKVMVICGGGSGKTSAAIGEGIKALADGRTVTWIRFLKGRANESLMRVLKRLEPEMKAFSFETYDGVFTELSEEKKQEALVEIKNGIGFARKVMATESCDLLILDDLGTEVPNAFSASQLFYLINARLHAERGTVISTNLSLQKLRELYSDRTTSRIASEYDILMLYGGDIRAKKRMKEMGM